MIANRQSTDKIIFSTKAETLHKLLPIIKKAKILPLYYFTVKEWQLNPSSIINSINENIWSDQPLVVRSSSKSEDSEDQSLAGMFTSIIGVNGDDELKDAIIRVIASYKNGSPSDQVLIQPQLQNVSIAGVMFGIDPNTGGPYTVINFDRSGDTSSITSGQSNENCLLHYNLSPVAITDEFSNLVDLMKELRALFNTDSLDVEFAIDKYNNLYLFQVRPLVSGAVTPIELREHQGALERIAQKVRMGLVPHPYLYGKQTIYGVMPDWNPAEIIGIRPKPLALSLYRELVTDAVWAYQRDNYGYANLRSFPLLHDFEGLPYIDVRVSFNSFIPKELPPELAEKLVNYYLDRLKKTPELHDKVEFEIVFSCYTLDLSERLNQLDHYGFSKPDKSTIFDHLVKLTNGIIHNQQGLWKKDLAKIHELEKRQELIFDSSLDSVSKIYWIIEDCKRYGTLPFAGLARAGFVAIQLLKSFVTLGIINQNDYENFINSVSSISSDMHNDFRTLDKNEFLSKYGHLRPGTYDISSLRYDEAPDFYFNWNQTEAQAAHSKAVFALSLSQLRTIQAKIEADNLDITTLELLEFIKFAIESREFAKFIFSKSISEVLKLIAEYGSNYNFTREDCAYIDIRSILSLYSTAMDADDILHKNILLGKKKHTLSNSISLPPLITDESQVWSFEYPSTLPNFITQKSVTANICFDQGDKKLLKSAIVFIPSADPGYDWIFSHDIAGFITKFGGINSHMAIRAGELGIPAIIGAGEVNYNKWSNARKITMNCANKIVQVIT